MASQTNINVSNRTLANTSSTQFRNLVAKTAVDYIWNDNQLFFFAAKDTTPGGVSADSLKGTEVVYENIVVMERVTEDDVSLVVPRLNWVSGKVYNAFDPDVNLYEYTVAFDGSVIYPYLPYVMTDDYNVYLCIKNCESGLERDRTQSKVKPTSVGTQEFTLKDGYTWKYLYSVSDELFTFLTTKWLPVPRPIKSIPTNLNTSSAKYRQFQVQENAKTTAGKINDVKIDLGQKNVYFDMPNPQTTVVGQGSGASVQLSTSFEAGKGYKVTGYRVGNAGTGYVGGNLSLIDSPNSNGDVTSKTDLESKITLSSSYGGIETDLGTDPTTTLQARTMMFVGNMRQGDSSLGSFPPGVTMQAFGLIANPVYATGDFAGKVAGQEFGSGGNRTLNLRQATKVKLKDNSGTGFTITTAKAINDNRLKFNSSVEFQTSKTDGKVIDLQPLNLSDSGNSNRADLFLTGTKTLPIAGETILGSQGDTFECEQVFEPTLKVGSGDLLYIIPVTFNILEEQLYTTRFIIPL